MRGGVELFSHDPARGHHRQVGQLLAKLEASLFRFLPQGGLRAREVLLGLLAGFLLRPGDGGLRDLPRLADDLLRLLSRLGEDLFVADAGSRHFRLHRIGGRHALRNPARALVEHVCDGAEGVLPEEQNEDDEGDELDRQPPGVDTKFGHTRETPGRGVGVSGCQVTGSIGFPDTPTPCDPVTLV